jgi:hypothetical protein
MARGDAARAVALVEELDELTRRVGTFRDFCLAWPARIAIAAGRPDLVEAFLDGSEFDSAWSRSVRPTALAMLAEARGETGRATELYRDAAERWEAYGSVVEQAYALLGLGRCGDAAAFVEGEAILARLGAVPLVAKAA